MHAVPISFVSAGKVRPCNRFTLFQHNLDVQLVVEHQTQVLVLVSPWDVLTAQPDGSFRTLRRNASPSPLGRTTITAHFVNPNFIPKTVAQASIKATAILSSSRVPAKLTLSSANNKVVTNIYKKRLCRTLGP
jgi:hypothetical protein